MKKLISIAALTVLLSGCGVGTYSLQSGVEDAAFVSFTDNTKHPIDVVIDDNTYQVETVRQKAYKSGRNIRKTVENTIKLATGQHLVKVYQNGQEIYSYRIFLSTGDSKIIEL